MAWPQSFDCICCGLSRWLFDILCFMAWPNSQSQCVKFQIADGDVNPTCSLNRSYWFEYFQNELPVIFFCFHLNRIIEFIRPSASISSNCLLRPDNTIIISIHSLCFLLLLTHKKLKPLLVKRESRDRVFSPQWGQVFAGGEYDKRSPAWSISHFISVSEASFLKF